MKKNYNNIMTIFIRETKLHNKNEELQNLIIERSHDVTAFD